MRRSASLHERRADGRARNDRNDAVRLLRLRLAWSDRIADPDIMRRPVHSIPARDLLAAELAAARLQGALGACPDAARLWRRIVMFEEARALAGLRGPALSAEALATALWPEASSGRTSAGDGIVASAAGALWRDAGEARSDALLEAASLALAWDRCEALHDNDPDTSAAAKWVPGEAPQLEPAGPGVAEAAALRGRLEALADDIGVLCARPDATASPLLAAWMGVRRAEAHTLDIPAFGCVLLQRLDGALRRPPAFSAAGVADTPDWVLTPARAVRGHAHSVWAPHGQAADPPFAALARIMADDLGLVGALAAWADRLEAWGAAGQGRSRRRDLTTCLRATPVIGAAALAAATGVTDRSARGSLAAAEEAGLVRSITPRARDRLWAVPALADRLRGDPGTARRPSPGAARWTTHAAAPPSADPEYVRRIDAIMGDIDAAIADIDRLQPRGAAAESTPPDEL